MNVIEIHLRTLEQLFHTLDPSPFHEKSLDPQAEQYLLDYAESFPRHEEMKVVIHGPVDLQSHLDEIRKAIHSHFQVLHERALRRLRARMRNGHFTLLLGISVLVACLLLRSIIVGKSVSWQFLSEGLLILGWVSLWRPVEVLLFDRWELKQKHALLQKLAAVPIEFQAAAAER